MRKEIDINTWERKEHFEFYSNINHRFIDGYFVGQFVQKLEEKIAALK